MARLWRDGRSRSRPRSRAWPSPFFAPAGAEAARRTCVCGRLPTDSLAVQYPPPHTHPGPAPHTTVHMARLEISKARWQASVRVHWHLLQTDDVRRVAGDRLLQRKAVTAARLPHARRRSRRRHLFASQRHGKRRVTLCVCMWVGEGELNKHIYMTKQLRRETSQASAQSIAIPGDDGARRGVRHSLCGCRTWPTPEHRRRPCS